jgi:hypothetical protein
VGAAIHGSAVHHAQVAHQTDVGALVADDGHPVRPNRDGAGGA